MINYYFNIIRNKNRVKSSNVKNWEYDTEQNILTIEFNDGSRYLYEFIDYQEFLDVVEGNAVCKTSGKNKFGEWFIGKTPSVGAAIHEYLIQTGKFYTKLSKKNMLKKIDLDKLPVYELEVDENGESGIKLISIVENPAIEVKGYAFSEESYYEFEEIEDEKIIIGPALIPNQKIYQEDEKHGPHYVMFSPEGIRRMVEKFNKSGSNRRINVEHTNSMVDAFIFEDWIVEDLVYDKSRKYNFDVPIGTYMISVKVDDENFWKEKVRGENKFSFSVEGLLKSRLVSFSKDLTIDDLEEEDLLELLEFIEMAEVGKRGGIVPSKKAPKSDTPNPNPKGKGTAKGDASSTRGAEVSERVEKILEEKAADFNEKYKEKLGFGVDKGMLKSVYQRGVGAFNVSHSPKVKSAEQWALARVNAFLYLVKNGRPENPKYDGDNDLLPKKHKKRVEFIELACPPKGDGLTTKGEPDKRCKDDEARNNSQGISDKKGVKEKVKIKSKSFPGVQSKDISVEMPDIDENIKREALEQIAYTQAMMLEIKKNHGENSQSAKNANDLRVRYNDGEKIHVWYKDGQGSSRIDNDNWLYKQETTERWATSKGWTRDILRP